MLTVQQVIRYSTDRKVLVDMMNDHEGSCEFKSHSMCEVWSVSEMWLSYTDEVLKNHDEDVRIVGSWTEYRPTINDNYDPKHAK